MKYLNIVTIRNNETGELTGLDKRLSDGGFLNTKNGRRYVGADLRSDAQEGGTYGLRQVLDGLDEDCNEGRATLVSIDDAAVAAIRGRK